MYTEGIDYDGVRNSLMQEYGLSNSSSDSVFMFKSAAKVAPSIGLMSKLAPYGVGAAIAGTVGTLGYAAKTQMEDNRKPLHMQVFDANTALGSGARVVGLVGASILAAAAANEMTRSRQGSQHI